MPADYRSQISENVDALVKDGAIPADLRDQYIEMMAKDEKVAERFAGMLMRGSDYTRKTQALAEQRRQQEAELQAERQRVLAEQSELKQWEAEARAEIDQLRLAATQNPALQAQIARYEQKLADYNLLEDGDRVQIPTAVPKGEPAVTTPQSQTQLPADYLKRDDAAFAIRDLMILNGQVMAIAGEHQALFGKPLTENLLQEAMNAGVQDVRQFWESKYNVQGKRAEVEQARYNAELERVRADERAKVMAELTSDPSRVIGGPAYQQAPKSHLLDTYAQASRAVIQNGEMKDLREVPPELRPEPAAAAARMDRAMTAFLKDFNPDGSPRLAGGPAQ